MEIEGITLWLFCGVATSKGNFPSAGAEPGSPWPVRVTLVLGGFLSAAAIAIAFPPAVDRVIAWLGYINFILLGFNLLPLRCLSTAVACCGPRCGTGEATANRQRESPPRSAAASDTP